MKHKKHIIFIILLISTYKTSFSEIKGGFEAIINVPLGIGLL